MRYPQPTATLHRLRTQPERIAHEDGERLRQLVLSLDLPERPVAQIVAAIDRQVATEKGWTFAMVSPDQNTAVVDWLVENSSRPMVAVKLWSRLFKHLRHDTAEIVATRQELAEAVGVQPRHVSTIMGELEGINAVVRSREGRNVRYFMNPNVATMLGGHQREVAQRKAGQLRLVGA